MEQRHAELLALADRLTEMTRGYCGDSPFGSGTCGKAAAAIRDCVKREQELEQELEMMVVTSGDLCDRCGWRCVFPDEGCVNCIANKDKWPNVAMSPDRPVIEAECTRGLTEMRDMPRDEAKPLTLGDVELQVHRYGPWIRATCNTPYFWLGASGYTANGWEFRNRHNHDPITEDEFFDICRRARQTGGEVYE